MPTDTPSPLAAAAEALLKAIRGATFIRDLNLDEVAPAVDALRAALAADAAWRARAEAAVAWVESYRNCRVAMKKAEAERTQEAEAECRAALDVYDAARRRYEETCRAG